MVILQCKGAPYLERLTTILSSIWTSLTLFSMGVKRSDLRGVSRVTMMMVMIMMMMVMMVTMMGVKWSNLRGGSTAL